MRMGAGIWAAGIAASLVVHLGAGAGLMAALQPRPVVDQPTPETRLNIEAQDVARSNAAERTPTSQETQSATAKGSRLPSGTIAQSVAASLAPRANTAPAQEIADVAFKPSDVPAPPVQGAARLPIATLIAAQPSGTNAAAPVQPAPAKASARAPSGTELIVKAPSAAAAISAPLPVKPSVPGAPAIQGVAPATLDTAQTASLAPPSTSITEGAPEFTSGKAVLAFPGNGVIDPVSLAAFQNLTSPQSSGGEDVRDSLSAALAVPCARMQVTFDPDTTTLQLTGHVPQAEDRAPVLAALQAQMGQDITVTDNLLILPAPQCGALSGIASVGLPQSTDQITNPLIVGRDTHARAFRYTAGEPLVLELTAPDYASFIYVDYFDADGNVIHLSPNDRTPLQMADPKTALEIGARSAEENGLFVTIGPPYGQEIAAAFAASVPLYPGLRPLVEPAEPYLAWLKTRVAKARAQDPDFKGEWVYFFVTTAED